MKKEKILLNQIGLKYIETTPENIESFNETLLMFVKEILNVYGINETISENIIEKKMKKKKNKCIIF